MKDLFGNSTESENQTNAKIPKKTSKGLKYKLNDDKSGYSVTGIGTCTDTKVIIPNKYKGKAVVEISSFAFEDCTGLKSVNYTGTQEQWKAISKGYDWNYNTGDYTVTYNYNG